jgi:hypothetical protein
MASMRLLPSAFLAGEVGTGLWIDAAARDRDDVQSAVELAIATAVQAVTVVSAGGHRNRCDPSDPGELRIALEALCASGLPDQDRGTQRARRSA